MKTIGIIGGLSWESTASYYKLLNEGVKENKGGLHSAKIILHSLDLDAMHTLQYQDKWDEVGEILAKHAKEIEIAGADFILIATNTMHKVAPIVEKNLSIPLIHIATATAEAIKEKKCKKSILLGTKFTMSEDFNKKIFQAHDIQIVTPSEKNIQIINNIIFDELAVGKILEKSKETFLEIIKELCEEDKQIDSVILGCTEIGLLIKEKDTNLEVFDTTLVHVNKALNIALKT